MVCHACGTENRPGRKFCARCAAALAIACPGCQSPNEPGELFCGECAAPLAVPPTKPVETLPAHVAERRLVTVLFADLVGFTPFSEERDAEEVRETLSRYFDLASAVIGRHGGTVEKFIGDAVMAVWGAPVAREDDAERAVRAGLELLHAIPGLEAGMAARAGILTGEAAVTLGAQGQGMVAGDLVTTASRLQSVAAPGTVLVGEATMRAASRAIAFEPAGDQALRGKAAPVPAWRAGPVVAERGGRGRSDVLEPPFVGRAEELRALKEALHATGRDRRPRLVSITGPAGIGKSRLAWELEKYVDGLVEPVYWHAGRSPSHGDGIAAWALGEMVRRRAGLAEGDDEPTTRAALNRLLAEWVPAGEDRRWVEPALLTLLGLAPPPPGGRDVLFAGWRILFEQIAARGTNILLFEDMHAADDGLLDFVEHLLEWAKASPILVVTLARPELVDRRPGWGTGTRAAISLALEPLDAAEMRGLVLGLVPEMPERPLATIVERAAGIPLYAVETIRMLIVDRRLERSDGGWRPVGEIADLAVPETLRSLVAARLDALTPADRAFVEDAAVLGGSFSIDALAAVGGVATDALEARLGGLVRHELLRVEIDPRSPERGQYAFVQALVREVAYRTLARRDRRARHLAAARYMEGLGNEETAGALAAHYLAAYRDSAGPEADALATQARITLTGAAGRAFDLGAHDQAVALVEQALPLPMSVGDEGALLEIAARATNLAGQQAAAEDYARRALACREAEGDESAVARDTGLVAMILYSAGRVEDAMPFLEAALARRAPDGAEEADAILLTHLSRVCSVSMRDEQCLAAAERALPIAERLDLDDLVAHALISKAVALSDLDRWREAVALAEGVFPLAHACGDGDAEGRALVNLAYVVGVDDVPRALAANRRNLEFQQRLGRRSRLAVSASNLAGSMIQLAADWDEPLRLAGELLLVDTGPRDRFDLESIVIDVLSARGELDDERYAALEAVAASLADPQRSASFELIRATVAWRRGDFDLAIRAGLSAAEHPAKTAEGLWHARRGALWLRDAATVAAILVRLEASPHNARFRKAALAVATAALAALDGRTFQAAEDYRRSLALLHEGGFELAAAETALDYLWAVGSAVPEAQTAAEEARAVFERVRAKVYLERLDSVMGLSPHTPSPHPSVRTAQ